MTRIVTGTGLALVLWLTPLEALGQSERAAPLVKDKQEEPINEIERGLYCGVTAGGWFLVNPPASGGSKQPFSPGQVAEVEVGMDFGDRLSAGVYLLGSGNRAGAEYTGKSGNPPRASGDFSILAPGAVARFNLVGFQDGQQVRRTWIYARGGAGYVIFSPKALLPNPDILIFAGPGVEYYTRLRHFSLGVEVTGLYLLTSSSVGFAITPNLRYAF